MKAFQSFAIFIFICSIFVQLPSCQPAELTNGQCGGTIELDRGSLEYPGEGTVTPGQVCIWTVHLPSRNGFRINFTDVHIPSDDTSCSETSLRVTSLSNLFVGDLETISVCNGNPSTNDGFLNGNTLAIVFRTSPDWVVDSNTKFSINWEGSLVQPNAPEHTSTFTTTSSGIVRYPIEGDYPPNSVVTWLVQPRDPATSTEITVSDTNFEPCSLEDSCYCDALIFYEITQQGFVQESQRFCEETIGGRILQDRSSFIAIFFSDISGMVGKGQGFEFVWKEGTSTPPTSTATTITTTQPSTITTQPSTQTTQPSTITTTPSTTESIITTTEDNGPLPEIKTCGGIIEAERGIISFLEDEEYTNSLRCAWTIRSPLHSRTLIVKKLFSGFELGFDYLSVFGFNTYDSTETTLGKTTNEEEYRSISGAVVILVFTANAINTGKGFRVEFEFTGDPMSGVRQYVDLNTAETSGNFTVGGPLGNYGNNVLSTFVISNGNYFHTGITMSLTADIYEIEMGGGIDPCGYDGIRVYTVGLENLSFFGKYCSWSTTTVGPFLARNMYILVFASDSSVDKGGFTLFWNLR